MLWGQSAPSRISSLATTYSLLGPNGAGKSSTLAVVLGLQPPDAGHIPLLGQDPRAESRVIH